MNDLQRAAMEAGGWYFYRMSDVFPGVAEVYRTVIKPSITYAIHAYVLPGGEIRACGEGCASIREGYCDTDN